MATIAELQAQTQQSELQPSEENNDVGNVQSILAGLASGLIKIPEGFVSLGATLIDLGADTNKAAEVERWFANINPFDEMAEATTAGKITELIVNLAVPGGIAFKAGTSLAKGAILASQSGKYMNVAGKAGKGIQDAVQKKLQKIAGPDLTTRGKLATFGSGAVAGGVAEGIFVGDVEDAGTFGDLIGGPTELDRGLEGSEYDPARELLNRLKFGIEGAAFTGLLGAAGQGIKKLKDTTDAGKAVDGAFNKFIDRWISQPFRARKDATQEAFEQGMRLEGAQASDLNVTEGIVRELDAQISKLFPWFKRVIGDKTVDAERKALLKEMNEVLLSSEKYANKLDPTYNFAVTRRLNEAGKQAYQKAKKQYSPTRTDVLTEEEFIKKIPPDRRRMLTRIEQTGIEKVKFGKMNTPAMKKFTEKLKKLGAKDIDIEDVKINLAVMRAGWGDLFSSMGRRLDEKGATEFKLRFGDKVTTWLDSTYEIFKNRKSRLGEMYTPSAQIMSEAKQSFKELYKKNVGKELSDSAAEQEVKKVYNSAFNPETRKPNIEQGFKLKSQSDPYFEVPGYFVAKSAADELTKMKAVNMSELTGVPREIIEKLYGKGDDALKTILNGTNRLSAIVRRNEYFDKLGIESLQMKEVYKAWVDGGRIGKAPPRPTFADTAEEAQEIFGGIKGVDWKAVTPISVKQSGVKGVEKLQPNLDYAQTLKPLEGEVRPTFKKIDKQLADEIYAAEALSLENIKNISANKGIRPQKGFVDVELDIYNPLQTKFALTGTVDNIVRPIEDLAKSQGMTSQLYQNLILYPKATSQMAKTILSPFTHARNFISAGAFAMANGIVPFSDMGAVKKALNALQTPLYATRKKLIREVGETDAQFITRKNQSQVGNEFYQKLLKLGVVNSQVQLGDLQRLLSDVNFGGITGKLADNLAVDGLNKLLKGFSKVKKFSEDMYTAEDDFWKIFSFLGESKRLKTAYEKSGLNLGEQVHTMKDSKRYNELIEAGMEEAQALKQVPKRRFDEAFIDEEAANIVKNNIPNYAYVSEFVKGLRKLPLGNFVSFPAEIMRTGTNIVQRGLDEFFYKTVINGQTVRPFRSIGMKRLSGMAFTTVAVPSGAVAGASMIYDVTADEREAMRNFVAKWSKNSTLIPIRDKKTGKLSYVDFSHTNAYDTLTRPIQTIINNVQAGRKDQDGMMDDFFLGVIEATKELASPFVTESIWTEALSDLVMRGGLTREGFKVWNKEDEIGTKMSKGMFHLIQAQAPLNWKQLERINLSMKPKDDIDRLDERGRGYELGNELAGIAGLRVIDIEPEKGMIYKTADYLRGARDSKALFSTVALKGGKVTPESLLDAYINTNRALFENQKTLYKDLKAAEILKADMTKIYPYVSSKVGKRNYGAINNGRFIPYLPSRNVFIKSQQITNELRKTDPSYENPLPKAITEMGKIRGMLYDLDLDTDEGLPEIENPFSISLGEGFMETVRGSLPESVTGFLGEGNTNIGQVQGVTPLQVTAQKGKNLFKNDITFNG